MPRFKKTLLDQLNAMPPFLVYYLARKPKGKRRGGYANTLRVPTDELITRSGLSERTFFRIASQKKWDSVRASQIQSFCTACGIDLLHQNPERTFLRKTLTHERPMAHLTTREYHGFKRMCDDWAKTLAATPEAPSH